MNEIKDFRTWFFSQSLSGADFLQFSALYFDAVNEDMDDDGDDYEDDDDDDDDDDEDDGDDDEVTMMMIIIYTYIHAHTHVYTPLHSFMCSHVYSCSCQQEVHHHCFCEFKKKTGMSLIT